MASEKSPLFKAISTSAREIIKIKDNLTEERITKVINRNFTPAGAHEEKILSDLIQHILFGDGETCGSNVKHSQVLNTFGRAWGFKSFAQLQACGSEAVLRDLKTTESKMLGGNSQFV